MTAIAKAFTTNPKAPTVRHKPAQPTLTCIEICSGAGGQALGWERAGFEALAHVEYDRHACETLRLNRPDWNVVEGDVRDFSAKGFKGVDLLAGGVPLPAVLESGQAARLQRRARPFPRSSPGAADACLP